MVAVDTMDVEHTYLVTLSIVANLRSSKVLAKNLESEYP